MSGLELWPNSLPRQEQQAPQEPESQSFQVISSGGDNLQSPEEFLRHIVFANGVFKGQIEVELSKIIFVTACLAKKLEQNRQIFGD